MVYPRTDSFNHIFTKIRRPLRLTIDDEKSSGKRWCQGCSDADYFMQMSDTAHYPSGTKGNVGSKIGRYIFNLACINLLSPYMYKYYIGVLAKTV